MDNTPIGGGYRRLKIRPLYIVVAVVFVFVVAIAIYFYALVRENVSDLENSDTNDGAFPIELLDTIDDPYTGGRNADIVIVEFSDYQCPYCLSAFYTLRDLREKYGDKIKIVYRDMPNESTHPDAQKAAEAGECAHEQGKFWEMHDTMFLNQGDLSLSALKQYAAQVGLDTERFNTCLDGGKYTEEVEQDLTTGIIAGATGTPTFFINGHMFTGTNTYDKFVYTIDELLAIYEAE